MAEAACALKQQLSRAPCTASLTFGCNGTHVWVSGRCRGRFRCGAAGRVVACGSWQSSRPTGRHHCSCGTRTLAARSCAAKAASFAEPSLSGQRGTAAAFCAQPTDAQLLAALGVFSIDEHVAHRSAVRSTWLGREPSVAATFVLDGIDARVESLAEAAAHRDMLFVRGSARQTCKQGPLAKLLLWLECALVAWPRAQLVGKADDDLWASLPGVALHVRRSLAVACRAVRGAGAGGAAPCAAAESGPLLFWGSLETFHWHEGIHRPVGFGGAGVLRALLPLGGGRWRRARANQGLASCQRRPAPRVDWAESRSLPRAWEQPGWRGGEGGVEADSSGSNVSGPFFFGKGPLYLVDRRLAAQVVAHADVRREAAAAVRSGEAAGPELTWPWEDVFLGYALAHAATSAAAASAPAEIVAVDIGARGVFTEGWGVASAPVALLWHMRVKQPARVALVDAWAASHRCDLAFDALRCEEYRSCAGASWRACRPVVDERRNANCSSRLKDVA